MFKKIKRLPKQPFIQQFRDTRAVGLAAFGIVAILVTWSGFKAVQTNYDLQKQISNLQQQNTVSQLENNNLALQNKYYETDQYLELQARSQFGLGDAGETELLVPQNVALSHTVNLPQTTQTATSSQTIQRPAYQRNFQDWVDFFLDRKTSAQ
jgi:cell division protein FtsB